MKITIHIKKLRPFFFLKGVWGTIFISAIFQLSEDVPLVQPPAKVRDDPALSIYVPGQVFGLVSIDPKG